MKIYEEISRNCKKTIAEKDLMGEIIKPEILTEM